MKMRNIIPILVTVTLLFGGCGSTTKTSDKKKQKRYTTAKEDAVLTNLPEAEEVELDDAYYEEHWKDATKLVWVNDAVLPSNVLIALNDRLVREKGFVIQMENKSITEDSYQDDLLKRKEEGEATDLINVGSCAAASDTNRYQEAVEKGLLEPLDPYLTGEKKKLGSHLYESYLKEEWEAMKVDGKIYSYDWRQQPVSDVCAFVNKAYLKKYDMQLKGNETCEELLQMAEKVNKKEKRKGFCPVLLRVEKEEIADWGIEELTTQVKERGDLIWGYNQPGMDWSLPTDFFVLYAEENRQDSNDNEVLLNEKLLYQTQKVVIKKDTYQPVTNCLTAVASWSEHKDEVVEFLDLIHGDADYANLLQYGVEGENYVLEDGKAVIDEDHPGLMAFSIGNKWITYPRALEPDTVEEKERWYRDYIGEHFKK